MLKSAHSILSIIRKFNEIYFYCVDPGAFSVLYPVYKAKDDQTNITWILDGWCRDNKKEIFCVELDTFKASCDFRDNKGVCLVLGSQTNFKTTRCIIGYCRGKRIYSVFVFDHWCNYLSHFYDKQISKLYLPDKICVMDDDAKRSLIYATASHLEDKGYLENIAIVGHPGIEQSVETIHNISNEERAEIRRKINAGNKKVDLFLLEPIEDAYGYDLEGKPRQGYTEYSILRYFLCNIWLGNTKVIIKPHPRQDVSKIRTFLSNIANFNDFDYELEEQLSLEQLIAVADIVYGVTTIGLIIASKAGKKIRSIQVGRNDNAPMVSNEVLERNLVV